MGLQIQKEGVAKGVNIDGMWEGKSLMQRMEKMKNAKRFKQKVSQSRLSRAHFGVRTSTCTARRPKLIVSDRSDGTVGRRLPQLM
jgi:hypothetical protein